MRFDGPAEAIHALRWVPSEPVDASAAATTGGSAPGVRRKGSASCGSGLVGSCAQLIQDGKRVLTEALETYGDQKSNQGQLTKNLLRRKQVRMVSERSTGDKQSAPAAEKDADRYCAILKELRDIKKQCPKWRVRTGQLALENAEVLTDELHGPRGGIAAFRRDY